MRALQLLFVVVMVLPLQAAELLLLSMTPAADYQDEYNTYHPVKMVRQVLRYYPGPYQIESVSLNRAFAELRKTPGACTPVVRKSAARLQQYLFSEAFVIAPDIRLLVKKHSVWHTRLQRMQSVSGRISLAHLLQLPYPPVLVTEDGRVYGDELDQLLATHRNANAVYVHTAKTSRYGELLPMLLKDFVDMTLEFTVAIPDDAQESFSAFRLTEAPDYSLAYFACGRDETSVQVLEKLNTAIEAFRQSAEFRQMLLSPFAPAERPAAWRAWLQLNRQQNLLANPVTSSQFYAGASR